MVQFLLSILVLITVYSLVNYKQTFRQAQELQYIKHNSINRAADESKMFERENMYFKGCVAVIYYIVLIALLFTKAFYVGIVLMITMTVYSALQKHRKKRSLILSITNELIEAAFVFWAFYHFVLQGMW